MKHEEIFVLEFRCFGNSLGINPYLYYLGIKIFKFINH